MSERKDGSISDEELGALTRFNPLALLKVRDWTFNSARYWERDYPDMPGVGLLPSMAAVRINEANQVQVALEEACAVCYVENYSTHWSI